MNFMYDLQEASHVFNNISRGYIANLNLQYEGCVGSIRTLGRYQDSIRRAVSQCDSAKISLNHAEVRVKDAQIALDKATAHAQLVADAFSSAVSSGAVSSGAVSSSAAAAASTHSSTLPKVLPQGKVSAASVNGHLGVEEKIGDGSSACVDGDTDEFLGSDSEFSHSSESVTTSSVSSACGSSDSSSATTTALSAAPRSPTKTEGSNPGKTEGSNPGKTEGSNPGNSVSLAPANSGSFLSFNSFNSALREKLSPLIAFASGTMASSVDDGKLVRYPFSVMDIQILIFLIYYDEVFSVCI